MAAEKSIENLESSYNLNPILFVSEQEGTKNISYFSELHIKIIKNLLFLFFTFKYFRRDR